MSRLIRLALGLAALSTLASCSTREEQAQVRLCVQDSDCPPRRICSPDGACVLPPVEDRLICRGDALVRLRVTCDDYLCESPQVQEISATDCRQAPAPTCEDDVFVTLGPGRCDPAEERCVYREIERYDCGGSEIFCEGDDKIVRRFSGCNDDGDQCLFDDEVVDCLAAQAGGTEPYCEDGRFLVRPFPREELAACDPVISDCRRLATERVDCAADVDECRGDVSLHRESGRCAENECVWDETTETRCALAQPGECDGDLLIARPEGGVCDPVSGRCRFPEPELTDCAQEEVTCTPWNPELDEPVGEPTGLPVISRLRAGGACDPVAGSCTGAVSRVNCATDQPEACRDGVDGAPPVIVAQRGGICLRETGACAYPDPVEVPCETTWACDGDGRSVRTQPVGCDEGGCLTERNVVDCPPPSGFCQDGVPYNFPADVFGCDPDTGRCRDGVADAEPGAPCPNELYCAGNVLHGPGDPACVIDAGIARCDGVGLLDCSRLPAPTCAGDKRHAFVGSGVCDAVQGCLYGDPVEEQCAACLPQGAVCVLPGAVRLDGGEVALTEGDEPLLATVDATFVMSATETTRSEVRALVAAGHLPADIEAGLLDCGADCPAVGLSWLDAIAVANARSVQDGLTPCYDGYGRVVGGYGEDPHLCIGWRLPSEAEWLLALRGQGRTRYACGDDPACLDAYAWHRGNTDGPRAVGTAEPDDRGLYDLSGNAREWVHDVFAEPTGGIDPFGPFDGEQRTLRGGSAQTPLADLHVFARHGYGRAERVPDAGVRLVRSLAPMPPSECITDPETGGEAARLIRERGACALTPGVPCSFDEARVPCPNGCRAGICLREEALYIDQLEGARIPEVDAGGPGDGGGPGGDGPGGDGPGGEGPGGGDGPGDGDGGEFPIDEVSYLPMPFDFQIIPGGTFTHGEGDAARRTVIAHDFYLMQTEMAYVQAFALMNDEDYEVSDIGLLVLRQLLFQITLPCDFSPVECLEGPIYGLTRLDATRVANRLSSLYGVPECYHAETGEVIDGGPDGDPQACLGFRLPTEAEWTYAARGGVTTTWTCGDDPTCLAQRATYQESANGLPEIEGLDIACPCSGPTCPLDAGDGSCVMPSTVFTGEENAFGLLNMAGNIAEWVEDYGVPGEGPTVGGLDPYAGPREGAFPVLKGGAWFDSAQALRPDARALVQPGFAFPAVGAGIRLARTMPHAEVPSTVVPGPATTANERVTITRSFEMGLHEASPALAAVLGVPYDLPSADCPDCPMANVAWTTATRTANALSLRQGLAPCYTPDGRVRGNPEQDPYRCEGWRLPTEAEWMVAADDLCRDDACLDDSATTLCTSALPDSDDDMRGRCMCDAGLDASYIESCGGAEPARHSTCGGQSLACFGASPVGSKAPGPFGLYDLGGNVREWMHDRWTTEPPAGIDPYGPAVGDPNGCRNGAQTCRTVRGGSWAAPRNAVGRREAFVGTNGRTGFRLVRTVHGGDVAQ